MSTFDWRSARSWYVNLACRPDRNEQVAAEFAKAGLPAERFDAFLPEEWPGSTKKIVPMWNRTKGAVGCYQSQTHVMRMGQGNPGMVGVFEDDVVFCDDLRTRLDYIQDHLTWDWDIFWLGATFHSNPAVWHKDTLGRDVERTADKHIFRTYGIWSTYAYFVNGPSVRKVLELLDQNIHQAYGIDHCCILHLEPVLKTYCMVPGCAWQRDGLSNIGKGVTTFSHFKKELGPYAWTARMGDFDPDNYDWGIANEV